MKLVMTLLVRDADNNDADEFWYADDLHLKRALSGVSPEHHAVAADRKHFVPRVLAAGTFFADEMTVRAGA